MSSQDSPVAIGFVSLHETFHPERGNACLATAIREQQLAESKWSAAWAEATLVVEEEDQGEDGDGEIKMIKGNRVDGGSISSEGEKSAATTGSTIPPWRKSNVFEFIFGISFAIAAVAHTFAIELGAAVVFAVAAAFYNTADFCRRQNNIFMCFWWAVFGFVYVTLEFTDSILLTLSVFIAELLAALGFLGTSLLGKQGFEWHQYIRKLCHLTRWAFRDFHGDWDKPKREFPLSGWSVCRGSDDNDDAKKGGAVLPVTGAAHVVVEEVTVI